MTILKAALSVVLLGTLAPATKTAPLGEARPNDNRVPAGRLAGTTLKIDLEARETLWYPEEKNNPGIPIYAFAERGKAPQVPGPLIRVPAGTEIRVSIRNSLAKAVLVRGLQDHNAAQLDTFDIGPGQERAITFTATAPGTYFYWGRTEGDRQNFGQTTDVALGGAFIVDPPGGKPVRDRVFVLSLWRDTLRTISPPRPKEATTVNGLSWPHTERFEYTVGDTINYRVINLGGVPHPMHMHGFYFSVDGRGDAVRDTIYTPSQRRKAVTEYMRPITTMHMSWVPTRPGNWLFHCHLVFHIARRLKLRYDEEHDAHAHLSNHAIDGMSGLVIGIHVSGRGVTRFPPDPVPRNHLRLYVNQKEKVYGDSLGFSFVLQEGPNPPARDSIRPLSSTIILKRNEPVEIMVVNHASSPVTIHWHGIELESYYDGVGDWSGWKQHTAPAIMPNDSFVVRMTPDRAGTFIYHTHSDENIQLTSGLYGSLIVLDENAKAANPDDRIFLMSNGGQGPFATPYLNGTATPPTIELSAGKTHRFRFVNITPAGIRRVRLLKNDSVTTWRAVAKDGADFPPAQVNVRLADFQSGPGETMDFDVTRDTAEKLALEMTTTVLQRVVSVVKIPVEVRAVGPGCMRCQP